MAKEVEKKYRINQMPAKLNGGNKIKQGYLDQEEHEVITLIREKFGEELNLDGIKEVRIRQKGEGENAKYYLTLKSDGTLEREEYEVNIRFEEFEECWPMATEGVIEKTRYEIALDSELLGELDEYEGQLEGLFSLEIEYDPETTDAVSLEEAVRSITDQAEDVTEFKCYKNKALAKTKSLEDLQEKVNKEINDKMMRDLNANPSQLNLA